jgi:serine/threonine protein kinase
MLWGCKSCAWFFAGNLEREEMNLTRATTFSFSPEVESRYRLMHQIGQGAYGAVVAAQDKVSGEYVAIKRIPNLFLSDVSARRTLREIKLLRFFRGHENIITLKRLFTTEAMQDYNDIYIVSELMGTDLHKLLQSGKSLTDEHYQAFAYQTLRALKFIHSGKRFTSYIAQL